MLAIFETALESNHAHPGLLMIDTPQKNLGGLADEAEFADMLTELRRVAYARVKHVRGGVLAWVTEVAPSLPIYSRRMGFRTAPFPCFRVVRISRRVEADAAMWSTGLSSPRPTGGPARQCGHHF